MINNEISQYPTWSQVYKEQGEKKVKILAKLHQGQNKDTGKPESALSEYGSLILGFVVVVVIVWFGLVWVVFAVFLIKKKSKHNAFTFFHY